jgi:hypothetical protein
LTQAVASTPRAIEPHRLGRILFGIVLAIGVGLRLVQLLRNPPLWLDELALANGVFSESFPGMFAGAADFAQSAPPGFLAIEWVLMRVFPASDLALRVAPFLFACLAIVATWLAAREISGERDAWVAAGLMAFANMLVFMSGQVKPYSADAFFTPLIFACALNHERTGTPASLRALFVAGAIGPLFSFGAVFANAGAAAFLLVRRLVQKSWTLFGAMFAVWAVTALVSVVLSHRMLSPEATEMMGRYWTPHYPPASPVAAVAWFWKKSLDLMWVAMGLREVRLFGLGALAGVALAWRQRKGASVLLATPLAAVMVAAIIRQYPYGERLLHWVIPVFALLLGVTASVAATWLRSRPNAAVRWAALIPGAFILAAPALSVAMVPPPYVRDNVAPIIDHLSGAAQPGDVVYVGWGAWHTWHRYGPQVKVPLGRVIIGGCPEDYPRGYLRDVDQLRGLPRVWLIFARVEEQEWRAQLARINYLDSIGVRAESLLVSVPGVSRSGRVFLYRYDLSDSARLANANAETFPVPEDMVHTQTGCWRFDAMYRRGDGTRVVPLLPKDPS